MPASMFNQYVPLIAAALTREFQTSRLDNAAILGNLGHESGGLASLQEERPTVKGSRGGYGWAQWTGPRRRAFEAWCKGVGLKPSSYDANLGYLLVELRGAYRGAIARVKAAGTLETKVQAFELAYEQAGIKHYESRFKWARRALALLPATRVAEEPTLPNIPPPPDIEPEPEVAVVEEPKPMTQSMTIWNTISAIVASGAASVLSFIQSPYALVALALVLAFGYVVIKERYRHRREDGV